MSARTGHDTPVAAQDVAGASSVRLGRSQLLARVAIRDAALEGLTGHETSLATGIDRHSIQPRISELRRKGLVIASGKRRRNPSGKTATVWIAIEHANGVPLAQAAN